MEVNEVKEDAVVKLSLAQSNGKYQADDIDIYTIHEQHAGRLVLDPEEARKEFGESISSKLKLTKDGKYVLWPQPCDDPKDPQNWTSRRKNFQLFIVILASIIPDFDSGIGIASLFPLARQYHTTTGVINNISSNWSIFLVGWGGIFFVMLMRKYGRLATLFWTQLIALGFLVGATFAPTLNVFAAMRCLSAFFGTCPQVTGLYTITDLFPFHLQARKINLWTMGVVLSPHVSPFLFGFLVARTTWRWAYAIGCLYGLGVLLLIIFFLEESMYTRQAVPKSEPLRVDKSRTGRISQRLKDLIGITGVREAKADPPWREICFAIVKISWRPHLVLILFFMAFVFGFSIGINVTITVFFQSPPPFGFGLSQTVASGIYATPVIAVVAGEIIGRYLNDWFMKREIGKNNGVFEAETRLWTCYIGVFFYVCGFVILGAALQDHLHKAAIIVGWAIAQAASLITTVAMRIVRILSPENMSVFNACLLGGVFLPSSIFYNLNVNFQGEISGLLNLARTLGGFSVAYYEVPWARKHGALQTLGCEAAIVAGLFILIVPFLQWKGRVLRDKFSPTT